ncbi:DUF4136 domain-containing protein [Mesonia sp.]|uniref:DUF4136 domain-containing protein n=1 Tax=Mesonia sp. TaxID=1960830 RepID=UPI001766F373|nr:DUF4136 domain-containing protein [Mesonia sp.]HIB37009.1 DUF4136 domain-containing protein [Mesonia sp.]HIO27384.1 DUF4136 domain-containing protein [Flavobacteriaceae bacterium]
MKRFLPVIFLFSILLLTSCGGPKAYFDYDQKANFDQFESYNFYDQMETGLNELDEDRMIQALNTGLSKRGFTSSATPDFKINFYTEVFEKQSNSSIGLGVGGGGGVVGGGVSGGIPVGGSRLYMSVTIEFTNAADDELYWQAVVEHQFNQDASPEERMYFFTEVVEKALENYPPEE